MYETANMAMRHRRRLESPTCAVPIMQQPDLGRMGRLTGPPNVTLGRLGDSTDDSALTTSGIFGIPWTDIALLGAALLGGTLLYKHFTGGGGSAPRRRSRKMHLPKISLPTVALLGAVAYFYAKSSSSS
jgi:hypothetical protein